MLPNHDINSAEADFWGVALLYQCAPATLRSSNRGLRGWLSISSAGRPAGSTQQPIGPDVTVLGPLQLLSCTCKFTKFTTKTSPQLDYYVMTRAATAARLGS